MTTIDEAIGMARNIGRDHGRNAASWYFDGNTDRATYERVGKGIDEGDPEILDDLPAPDLSGQWADGYTNTDLLRDCGVPVFRGANAIFDAYEEGFVDGVHHEIRREIAYHLSEGE